MTMMLMVMMIVMMRQLYRNGISLPNTTFLLFNDDHDVEIDDDDNDDDEEDYQY